MRDYSEESMRKICQKHEFSLNRIFPYKDRIIDSVLIQENMGQGKPLFSHVLRIVWTVSQNL